MKMVALGEVMRSRTGSVNPANYSDELFDLFSIPAHDRGGSETIPGKKIGSAKQTVQPGDVLLSRIIPHIRRSRVVPESSGRRQIASGEWIVFKSPEVDPEYLRHYLTSDRFHRQFMATTAGVGGSLTRARPEHVKLIGLPLPPLDEQRRIAAILDQADALRAKRRQVLAHLDALTQSIFHDMFGDRSFPRFPAGELMPSMRNGLSPATAGAYRATVLTLSAVTQGTFNPTAVKSGLFATEPPADKRVTTRDFMICRGNGNKSLVGVGAYSPKDRLDLVFPDTVIAGRIDPRLVSMPFLNAAWKQPNVRRQVESAARTTNGTYKVNQQTLSGVSVALPPLDLQSEFGSRVKRLDAQRAAVQRALAADDELFASLQACAFNGNL